VPDRHLGRGGIDRDDVADRRVVSASAADGRRERDDEV
jgi:hypothetical protein